MKILALDTTIWTSSVALWEDGVELDFQENLAPRDQAVILPSLLKEVWADHQVDLFLVNRGPGSFTGIRMGLAFAKGLSLGLKIPLKGIDGFQVAYESIETPQNVLVLIEAKRQDVFGQLFEQGTPLPPKSLTREDISDLLNVPVPPVLTGSGVRPFLGDMNFEDVTSPYRGAQALAYTFFKNPALATEPTPFYGREAAITLGA